MKSARGAFSAGTALETYMVALETDAFMKSMRTDPQLARRQIDADAATLRGKYSQTNGYAVWLIGDSRSALLLIHWRGRIRANE